MFSKTPSKIRRRPLLALFAALCLTAPCVPAQERKAAAESSPDVSRLRAHVEHLASGKLEGRRTGTRGAELAAEYVAKEFARLGLAPGGAATGERRDKFAPREYMQPFPYVAGVELGKGNALTLSLRFADGPRPDRPPKHGPHVGEDWMPLGFSSNARVENAPVAFVGYGIAASEQNYDDYKGVDVRDKIAVALAGTPDGDNPHSRFTRAGEIRFKAAAARAAGAKALVVIAGEVNFKDDKLSRLAHDNAGGDAGIPVAVISRRLGADVLGIFTVTDPVMGLGAFERQYREWKVNGTANPERIIKDSLNNVMSISTDVVRRSAPAANVVGVLRGADAKLKDEVIVVGAHYDHLGHGGRSSLAAREGEIHHGADDNASGTAALVELARLLSAGRDKQRRTVVFVAFGGEEEGLLGSSHYVAQPPVPLERTVAMINMDMVGRLKEDTLMIGGVGTAAEWRGWIEGTNRIFDVKVDPMGVGDGRPAGEPTAAATPPAPGPTKTEPPVVVTGSKGRVVATAVPGRRFNLRLNEDGFGPSDHSSFYARRLPVLFFFTGTHEDYHKPSDTAERINYEGLARVTGFVRDIVGELQASDARPTYTTAKTEANARSTGFRVYMGTVPSYGESTDGLKLDAVREGSPAEAAGLKAGDRIVRLAGREVRNVYDYTQALSEMKAGQQYEVEVVRDGARMTLKVTPAARK